MSAVTFRSTRGTSITIENIQSDAAFNILTAAFRVIDHVELIENDPETLEKHLSEGVLARLTDGTAVFLTNKPDNVIVMAEGEPLKQVDELQYAEGISTSDDRAGEAFVNAMLKLNELAHAEVERYVEEVIDGPLVKDDADPFVVLDDLGSNICVFADRLGEAHPSSASLYSFGSGVRMATGILSQLYDIDQNGV